MTDRRATIIVLALLLTLLGACTGPGGAPVEPTALPDAPTTTPTEEPTTAPIQEPTEPAAMEDPLAGTRWDLVQYGPADAPITPVSEATANFAEGQLTGTTGCNSYFGGYTIDGDSMIIGPEIGQTLMGCLEEGVMEQEQAFMSVLPGVNSFSLEGDTLILFYDGGQMVFEPAVDLTLEGQTWQLSGIATADAVVSTWIDVEITALFEGGQVSGYTGCNQYTATYTEDGATLTVGPVAATRRACDEERGQRELEFLMGLESVARYEIVRNNLSLVDAAGKAVLVFIPAEAPAEAIGQADLANATYLTDMTAEGIVTLVEGSFYAPAAPGSASTISIVLQDQVAAGDLNGDGAPETVAMLAANGGGTGVFVSLHVMERQGGTVVNTAWLVVGDRIVVNSLAVEDGQIVLDAIKHGPQDAMCCPSLHVVERYALTGDGLALVESAPVTGESAPVAPVASVPGGLDGFVAVLQESILTRNFNVLQSLMVDPLAFGAYASEGFELSPAEAIEELSQMHLPEGAVVSFSPPDTDLSAMLGGIPPETMLGPERDVARVLHSVGWGLDGAEEVMLFITSRDDGQFQLAAILVAPLGFSR